MPAPRRTPRLSQLILEVAAQAVQREVADPRLGFVTLTRVKLGKDLADATIYWSCLGTEAQKRTSARALEAATALVQSIVAKALQTRTTPTLTFRYDGSIVNAGHLESVFEKIKLERGEPESVGSVPPPPDDAPPGAPEADADVVAGAPPEADAEPAADSAATPPVFQRKKPRRARPGDHA